MGGSLGIIWALARAEPTATAIAKSTTWWARVPPIVIHIIATLEYVSLVDAPVAKKMRTTMPSKTA